MNRQFLIIRSLSLLLLCFFFYQNSFSQLKPGYINRSATVLAGRQVLDPDLNGYTSQTTSGFGAPSDVATSEIPYKTVQSYSLEPFGDLRRGPDHNYSDFVPDGGNDGFYAFFDGSNLLFRFRLGSIMPGSKGYSILLDTDGKFGASGPNADPNYQPATTGVNGNPGFEIEIVLETNFRIAVYNVDGTSSPVLAASYTNWQDMSQVSLASTNDNGDPDFFMDFYIPFSVLQAAPFNLTASSPIRMIPTTVMSPQAAIGGPKSDIYGLSDAAFTDPNAQYEAFINSQPVFTANNLSSGGGGIGSVCTAAPTVNGPTLSSGTVNISGTWAASGLTGSATTANITVYVNGSSVGTVSNVSSGSTWTLNGVAVTDGQIVTAKAQATGESMCLVSNSVLVLGCTPANTSATSSAAFGTCVNNRRGMAGTKVANAVIKIYSLTAGSSPTLFATDGTPSSPSTYNITYGSPSNVSNTTWEYNGTNNSGSADPCSGGPNDIPDGSYYITVTESGKCESAPIFGSCVNLSATATPVITQSVLYNGNATISGTAVASSTVRLYVNGILRSSQTATGGVFSFSNVLLNVNDNVQVFAQAASLCISSIVSRTVLCFSNTPLINADGNSQITAGQPITGTSSDPVGTVIRVYNASGPALVATTSVQSGGVWTTASVPYNAVAGITYYATGQNGSCGVSSSTSNVTAADPTSVSRCGTITGPVASGATSVSGTLASAVTSTVVRLYQDGILVGSTTTSTTAWTVSGISSSTIYSNGILTIGVQESGKQEVSCSAELIVSCSPSPAAPIFTPTNTTINANQTVVYTITNAVSGNFYAVSNSVTGQSLGTGVWATANGNLLLTTDPLTTPGAYSIVIKATSISGVTVCTATPSAASLTVNGIALPLVLNEIRADWNGEDVVLQWTTENEQSTDRFIVERSKNGIEFLPIGSVQAAVNSTIRKSYLFEDTNPDGKFNYYRLRMMDTDGGYVYSRTVTLRKSHNQHVSIWPIPFDHQLNVTYYSESNSVLELVVRDLAGRIVAEFRSSLFKGTNLVNLPNLGNLAKGTYLLEMVEGKNRSVYKITKN